MNALSTPFDDLSDAIAIVGLSGRFPGAGSVQDFWSAVLEGRELFAPHAPESLADAFTDAERAQPNYVPVRPALEGAALFDAEFFGMLPREASLMDPQFRVFLETCWEALEDAGHDPARAPGPVGVFGGASMSTYFLSSVLKDRATLETVVSNYQLGEFPALTGALGDTLSTRVAFKLGLTGPAMTVASACSTSLVAITQAVQSLLAHQCDMALAGGVSITFPQQRGYFYLEGGMASRDGHCRPFDAEASGTVFGHGAGVVALRRYADAVADGNSIYALIRGVGLNNDGNDKIAFTAPSVIGQALAIAEAQGAAGVEPDSIGYIECHGTATPLGDPIEFEALSRVFAGVAAGRVKLGSVKANIGHLDAAAGVAGVIKTALMLRDRVIPPMTNYTAPNPRIRLADSPFDIPTEARPWRETGPLRAGVSALGVGGTNAHIILEEAPLVTVARPGGVQILPISARSEVALAAMAQRLADALDTEGAPDLASVASTLQEGRSVFDYRAAIAAETLADASARLRAPLRAVKAARPAPGVRFMFPGQGSQYPLMAAGLHAAESEFRAVFAEGSAFLAPLIGLDLEKLVFGSADLDKAAEILRNTAVTQPALYLIQYALARLWQSRGVTPQAMVGHSVGEFAAATLAGVMSFETGLTLIAARGRLMQDQTPGSMLSVRAPVEEVAALVPDGVDLAARNAPRLNVFAGPDDQIAGFEAALNGAGIACSRLQTSHAFHSAMMDPVVEAIAEAARDCALQEPRIPIVSCVTGTWLTDAEATDPQYWARHCRATVNFHQAVQELCDAETPPVLLEVGPGRVLSAFAAQSLTRGAAAAVIQSLPDHRREIGDCQAMAGAHGALWAAGVPVDWSALRTDPVRRVSLPTYPFERKLHWIEPPVPVARQTSTAPAALTLPDDAGSFSEARPEMLQSVPRKDALTARLLDLLSELSGETITADDAAASFLELGFDSLLLGQVAQRLARDFGLEVTFNQLMTEYPSVVVLSAHMAATLPPEPEQVAQVLPATAGSFASVRAQAPGSASAAALSLPAAEGLASVLQAQTQAMLTLFDHQLKAVGGWAGAPAPAAAVPAPAPAGRAPVKAPATTGANDSKPDRFDLNRRRAAQAELTPAQNDLVARLTGDLAARFPTSKRRTQENRRVLADPRTAAGFRRDWKELVFPIVVERSAGAKLLDADGNELIDLVNGFGQTAFGHAPDFVTQAVAAQLEKGFAIGPQSPLAFEVARKFLDLTGHERVTFCNTGS
ncbi:MAG: type I polyketide synthase, partial [Pararhodobacter sp.]